MARSYDNSTVKRVAFGHTCDIFAELVFYIQPRTCVYQYCFVAAA